MRPPLDEYMSLFEEGDRRMALGDVSIVAPATAVTTPQTLTAKPRTTARLTYSTSAAGQRLAPRTARTTALMPVVAPILPRTTTRSVPRAEAAGTGSAVPLPPSPTGSSPLPPPPDSASSFSPTSTPLPDASAMYPPPPDAVAPPSAPVLYNPPGGSTAIVPADTSPAPTPTPSTSTSSRGFCWICLLLVAGGVYYATKK